MKFLFVSNLFPDTSEPTRGLFNARLIHHLGRLHEIRVISPRPVPGFPLFQKTSKRIARAEDEKFSPTFPLVGYIPKIGDRWNHLLMASCLRKPLVATKNEFPFQGILAAWAYPDCCAVARLATEIRVPFVAVAQGSDAHQYMKIPVRRRIMVESLNTASAVVTRSRELERLLREAGVRPEKLQTIYNGVEREIFQPDDRAAARAELNLPPDETILLFVGNLLAIKNPLLLVEAHAILARQNPPRATRLVMLGAGPLHEEILRRSDQLGTQQSVFLAGSQPPALVARHMQAADLLCITSDNEGMPNVLNEALSCGLRVVATRVGGIPEMLNENFLGATAERGNPEALAATIAGTLGKSASPEKIAEHVKRLSWENCAAEYARLLENAARDFQGK